MSTTCKEIIGHIEYFAPPALALEGDPIGLHLGSEDMEVRRLFLALELTESVVEEALGFQADMIFVHHTPFFKPLKQLREDMPHDRLILQLIRSHVALYTAHTNLDCVDGGVNNVLAELLGIEETTVLAQGKGQGDAREGSREENQGLGRIGMLRQPTTLGAYAAFVEKKLGGRCVRFCGKPEKMISRVACLGGAGGFLLKEAKDRGADAFVSADLRHHEAMQALELDLGLIDGGHFATENPVIPVLAAYLREKMPQLTIDISRIWADPFTYAGHQE